MFPRETTDAPARRSLAELLRDALGTAVQFATLGEATFDAQAAYRVRYLDPEETATMQDERRFDDRDRGRSRPAPIPVPEHREHREHPHRLALRRHRRPRRPGAVPARPAVCTMPIAPSPAPSGRRNTSVAPPG